MNHLRGNYNIMRLWAKRYNIPDFPKELPCIISKKPTKEMIEEGYKELSKYNRHPAYIHFFSNFK